MHLTRRALIGGAAAASLAAVGPKPLRSADLEPRLLGSAMDATGGFRVGLLDGALDGSDGAPVPVRLHALSPRPDGREAVAVGRRPGDVSFVLDGEGRRLRGSFRASAGRRFSGHGAYAEGGRSFLSAEIDAATGEGFVVVRDVREGYAPRGEFRSGGVGPHEVISAGGLIAVANGAKEPKSEPGVAALGTTCARSNLALVRPESGALETVAEVEEDSATLSLRHLALTPDGGVLVAAQDTAAGAHDRPLVARLDGARLRWLDAGYAVNARIGGSVGSLAIDRSGRFLAASGPRGGVVVVYDLAVEDAVGVVTIPDCCGLAAEPEPGRFIASNGLGEVVRIAADEDGAAIVARRIGALRWDNHLATLPQSAPG